MRRVAASSAIVVLLASCSTGPTSDGEGTATTTGTVSVSTTMPSAAATTVPAPGSVAISVVVGEDTGPDRVETVDVGATVKVTLTNPDSADDFHLHGYDLSTGEVAAGEEVVISFTADRAGSFELESHETGDVLVVLEVR